MKGSRSEAKRRTWFGVSTTLTNSLWFIITIDPLPSKCVVYGLNDRKAPHRLGVCHAISLRCGGNWDLGIGHIGDGLFFDLAFCCHPEVPLPVLQ